MAWYIQKVSENILSEFSSYDIKNNTVNYPGNFDYLVIFFGSKYSTGKNIRRGKCSSPNQNLAAFRRKNFPQ